ncbi:phosphatase PAP2 family protein [Paenibacillus sacheonensis]|uniref:phosphatase PAP2 family protein n=1 Tax=Paenibacillus sacheonensis TaxID=742054 RepID=UPI001EF8B497|nr:phosphatase PAP2 family protein [Paenibacillus sacheonensis]MBM7569020.1 hypothetical protein [Paenibacillus sacheonensis]
MKLQLQEEEGYPCGIGQHGSNNMATDCAVRLANARDDTGFCVLGGEVLDDELRMLFHRPGPVAAGIQLINTFPSEETLTSITVCGFTAFLLLRHDSHILVCLLVGISRIYSGVQFPSDVTAGYVFGGVWITLNVILLEVLRKLQDNGAMLVAN